MTPLKYTTYLPLRTHTTNNKQVKVKGAAAHKASLPTAASPDHFCCSSVGHFAKILIHQKLVKLLTPYLR